MLKKTITFTDFDGNERTEDFYFNLSKAEITEMECSVTGGLSVLLRKIIKTSDVVKLVVTFKEIICKSYGEKSDDGRRFIKSKELTDAFIQTEAYSELFMELSYNAEAASEFVKGIMPANLQDSLPAKA